MIENNAWTISTAIPQSLLPTTNTATIQQDFWLNTDPLVTSNLTDLPYLGCAFLLQGFEHEPISTGTNDSTSCNGVFDNDCYNAMKSVATYSARMFNTHVASIVPVCQDIGQAITSPRPPQCKNSPRSSFIQAGKSSAANPLPQRLLLCDQNIANEDIVPFGDVGSTSNGCDNQVFNGSATQAPIMSLGLDMLIPGKFTDYGNWIRRASPALMTVFKKTYWRPITAVGRLQVGLFDSKEYHGWKSNTDKWCRTGAWKAENVVDLGGCCLGYGILWWNHMVIPQGHLLVTLS